MDYRFFGFSRLGLTLVVAAAGCLSAPVAVAAGPRCDSNAFGTPQGPLFKTLDALAGGIESVLQRTVLSRRKSADCDAIGCDDACDHLTLQQLEPMPKGGVWPEEIPLPQDGARVPMSYLSPPSSGQPIPSGQAPARALPRVPADSHSHQPGVSGEDGWIESFTPSQRSIHNGPPRPTAPQNQQYDTLPNPFLDDPQGSR